MDINKLLGIIPAAKGKAAATAKGAHTDAKKHHAVEHRNTLKLKVAFKTKSIRARTADCVHYQVFGDLEVSNSDKHKIDFIEILRSQAEKTYGEEGPIKQKDKPMLFKDYDPLPNAIIQRKINYLYSPYNQDRDFS